MYLNNQQIYLSNEFYTLVFYFSQNSKETISEYNRFATAKGLTNKKLLLGLWTHFCLVCFVKKTVIRHDGFMLWIERFNFLHIWIAKSGLQAWKLAYISSEPEPLLIWFRTYPTLVLELLIAPCLLDVFLSNKIITKKKVTWLHISLWSETIWRQL